MHTPSKTTRREAEQDARRRFIVDTTRELLASREVEEVSMDEIARAAQYTRRTLYAYFKSRDEIFLTVFTTNKAERWSRQQVAVGRAGTGFEKLVAWARSHFEYSWANPGSDRLQAYWSFRGIDRSKISDQLFAEFEALNEELADGLRAIFHLGIEDGSMRPDLEVDLSISQFLYTIRAVIHRALSPGYTFASFEASTYFDHYLDLLARGIRTPEPTP